MDTLDNQYRIVVKFQFLSVPLAFAGSEVVFRHFHTLTLHQAGEVVFEQLVFYCLDVVEIVVAIGQARRVDTVHEVVVGANRIWA